MAFVGISNIACINAFAVQDVDNCLAGWVVCDAAHKDAFVAVAGEGCSGISGSAAGAKVNFININLGAKFKLIEKAFFVGAKIVVIHQEDVLKRSANADDASH